MYIYVRVYIGVFTYTYIYRRAVTGSALMKCGVIKSLQVIISITFLYPRNSMTAKSLFFTTANTEI